MKTSVALALLVSSAPAAEVILNEYNAVGGSKLLDDGDEVDSFWGPIEGNGGDWFELVAVGDGTARSTVDMRGWKILQFEDDGGLDLKGEFVLNNNPYWEMVRAGTILTFHEDDTADGGLDSHPGQLFGIDNFDSAGWAWKNIHTDDDAFVDTSYADHDSKLKLNNDGNVIEVYDDAGVLIFSAGEGTSDYQGGGVNSEEVLELREDPSTSVTSASDYDDSKGSTFGRPNSSGGNVQDFYAFAPEPSRALLLSFAFGATLLIRRRPSKG